MSCVTNVCHIYQRFRDSCALKFARANSFSLTALEGRPRNRAGGRRAAPGCRSRAVNDPRCREKTGGHGGTKCGARALLENEKTRMKIFATPPRSTKFLLSRVLRGDGGARLEFLTVQHTRAARPCATRLALDTSEPRTPAICTAFLAALDN